MKAIEFPGVNVRIAENQEEFQTIPVAQNTMFVTNENGEKVPVQHEEIMCFKLDENELKQVKNTGCIWLKVYRPAGDYFHPIGMDVLKPEFKQDMVQKEG